MFLVAGKDLKRVYCLNFYIFIFFIPIADIQDHPNASIQIFWPESIWKF